MSAPPPAALLPPSAATGTTPSAPLARRAHPALPTTTAQTARPCLSLPAPSARMLMGADDSCTDCPAGFYCETTSSLPAACAPGYHSLGFATHCTICPAGSECSDAAVDPVSCLPGEYSYTGSTSCTDCNPGYECTSAATMPNDPGYLCPQGYYCPTGTAAATACPIGTYGNVSGAQTYAEACQACTAGYYRPALASRL